MGLGQFRPPDYLPPPSYKKIILNIICIIICTVYYINIFMENKITYANCVQHLGETQDEDDVMTPSLIRRS